MNKNIDTRTGAMFNDGSINNSAMTSKVFVTQEQEKLNYSPAEEYGEVVFITRNEFSIMKASLRNEALIDEIASKLKSFDPSVDYITVSGSPVVAATVFLVLGLRKVRSVNMLRWSNRDCVYHPVTIQLTPNQI